MANISTIESEIKTKALLEAFEDLKIKTLAQKKDKRKNLATLKAVVIFANNNEHVLKKCKFKIGEKIFNQAKEFTPLYKLKYEIDNFKNEFPKIKTLANTKTREAIESIDRKLISNEEVNVELMLKYHDLQEENIFLEEKCERIQQTLDDFIKRKEEVHIENKKLKMQITKLSLKINVEAT